jgi:hypothetical protein
VFSSNLTPDEKTGLGSWTPAYFWRAMHNGRSKDGRLLYPAFPYPNYTQVTREDSDALFAYLASLPAVERAATRLRGEIVVGDDPAGPEVLLPGDTALAAAADEAAEEVVL